MAACEDAAVSGGLEMRGVASAEDADFDARVAAMKTWRLRADFVYLAIGSRGV